MNALKHTSTLSLISFALLAGFASAQEPEQLLEEPWVATKTDLLDVVAQDADTLTLDPRFQGASSRNFKAIAFGPSAFGAARTIVAIDGTKLVFFGEGQNGAEVLPPEIVPEIDLSTAAPDFSSVTAVAFISSDPVQFAVTGFSKRRRWFEFWIGTISSDNTVSFGPAPTITDHPQLTDMVYVSDEDAAGLVPGEGVLAAAGRQVLFFPASEDGTYGSVMQLRDARSLPIKNNASLLSVDLVGDALVVAASTRQLLAISPVVTAGPHAIPGSASCANIKPQRIVVRGADDGAVLYLADVCGQVLRYDANDLLEPNALPNAVGTHNAALVGLDIGEGNTVVCDFGEECQLSSDIISTIESPNQGSAALFVLEYELCDPRVTGAPCVGQDTVSPENVLLFNSRLPLADQDLLTEDVTIPPHIYASGAEGSFKAILVTSLDPIESTVFSAIQGPLPDQINLPRGTSVLTLLNQDEIAYAPDTAAYPTVGQYAPCDTDPFVPCFEATPVGIGPAHSTAGRIRGFSVIAYQVMMDLNPTDGLVPERCDALSATCPDYGEGLPPAGLPTDTNLDEEPGSPPMCPLDFGTEPFAPEDDWRYYFVNHAACLFADLAALLKSELIPTAAFGGNRASLEARIDNLGDKLAKASNAAGSSQAAQNYGAALSQLSNFLTELEATTFVPALDENGELKSYQIYKNELLVRGGKLDFQIRHRTLPSIPIGGIVP
jgi:hypothetical protein